MAYITYHIYTRLSQFISMSIIHSDSRAGSPVEFNETEAVCYLFTLGEVAQVYSIMSCNKWLLLN